jgi:hypothetical protein
MLDNWLRSLASLIALGDVRLAIAVSGLQNFQKKYSVIAGKLGRIQVIFKILPVTNSFSSVRAIEPS